MIFNNNDFHPPAPSLVIDGIIIGGTSDVRAGDLLVHRITSLAWRWRISTESNRERATFRQRWGLPTHCSAS
jgi:hypothetical protein